MATKITVTHSNGTNKNNTMNPTIPPDHQKLSVAKRDIKYININVTINPIINPTVPHMV